MKSAGELTDFFYDELFDELQTLETHRKTILAKLIRVNIVLALVFIPIFIWMAGADGIHDSLFIPLVIWAAIDGIAYKYLTSDYTHHFKKQIIEPLIRAIDPGLHYSHHMHISQYNFKRSHLFSEHFDRYRGNDLVKGTVNGIHMQFSDLHVERRTSGRNGKEEWLTIFQGLYIDCEFNKHFKGRTVVLPDHAEKVFGSMIGGWLQSNNTSRGELVRMDSPAFEKEFVVYGSDQIEARYLLTHSMMQRLLELKKRSGDHPVFISFNGGHIYIAVAYGKDMFEPTVFTSLLRYRQANEYIMILKNTIGIVEELKLNERLWTKHDGERSSVDEILPFV